MKNDEYFTTKPDGSQEGPYSQSALTSRIAVGKYPPGTKVWFKSLPDWEPMEKHFDMETGEPMQQQVASPAPAELETPDTQQELTPPRPIHTTNKATKQPEKPTAKRLVSVGSIVCSLLLLLAIVAAGYCFISVIFPNQTSETLTDSTQADTTSGSASQPNNSPTATQTTPAPDQQLSTPEDDDFDLLSDTEPTEEIEEITQEPGSPISTSQSTGGSDTKNSKNTNNKTTQVSSAQGKTTVVYDEFNSDTSDFADDESDSGNDSKKSNVANLTPEQKRELDSCKRKIKVAYKRKGNAYKKIAYYNLKIDLHDDCRSCDYSVFDCSYDKTCRHWATKDFDGKRVRVSHQLPRGAQRYSGIDQAISSLENKITAMNKVIEGADEMINEQRKKIIKITGSEDDVPKEPDYMYNDSDYSSRRRYSSGSSSYSSSSRSSRSSRSSY